MRPARSLAFDLNKSRVVPAEGKCFHELFQQQVRSAPEAVAIVFERGRLTYRELNGRANQLSHYLRMLGVGPESSGWNLGRAFADDANRSARDSQSRRCIRSS